MDKWNWKQYNVFEWGLWHVEFLGKECSTVKHQKLVLVLIAQCQNGLLLYIHLHQNTPLHFLQLFFEVNYYLSSFLDKKFFFNICIKRILIKRYIKHDLTLNLQYVLNFKWEISWLSKEYYIYGYLHKKCSKQIS